MNSRYRGIRIILISLIISMYVTMAHASPPNRIISLSPATTEILFSIGLGGRVVGVTNVCDRPVEALKKPKVGGMVTPSLESILALKPDIVVMIKEGNSKEVAERLKKLGIRVLIFSAKRLTDLPPAIRELGNKLGAKGPAATLSERIEAAIQGTVIRDSSKGVARKALFVISPSPLIVVGPGTIIDDAMALCGFKNIAADAIKGYPEMSLEAVIERQPEVIFIGSARGMKNQAENLLKRLKMVRAVQSGHICHVGDSLYRPGPRIIDGIAELERCAKML